MEKLISFSWGQFWFVDSLQFLNASLDKLVNSTPRDAFRLTSALPHHELLMQKGVYPYEYMDSLDRFDEKELPTQVIHWLLMAVCLLSSRLELYTGLFLESSPLMVFRFV